MYRNWRWLGLLAWMALGGACAHAITWTGAGDGRTWGVAANWDAGRIPGPSDDVLIPLVFSQVEHTGGNTVVRRVTAPGGLRLRGGVLRVTAGETRVGGSFVLMEDATLEADGLGVEVVMEGAPAEWAGTVMAKDGAVLRLDALVRLRGDGMYWVATGPGSLIAAPAVTNIILNTGGAFPIQARDQGRVDLSGLPVLRGPVQPDARDGGEIDLSGVRGRWTSIGFNNRGQVSATQGGRVGLGGVTAFEAAIITLDAPDGMATSQWVSLEGTLLRVSGGGMEFPAITNLNGSDLRASEGAALRFPKVTQIRGPSPYWLVDGPGSLIEAHAITNLALNTGATFPVQARNQGRVDLSGLGTVRGPLQPEAQSGAEIDLSGLRGRWTSDGFNNRASVVVSEGGRIRMEGVTEVDGMVMRTDARDGVATAQWVSMTDCNLNVEGAELDLGSVTNVNGSDIRLTDGALLRLPRVTQIRGDSPYWSVEGTGSLLDAREVREVVLNTGATFPIRVRNLGRVDLSGIGALRGPIQPDAQTGGEIDLSGARGRWTSAGFSNRAVVTALDGGVVRMPGITALDLATIVWDSAGGVATAQWESVTDCLLQLSDAEVSLTGVTNANGSDLRLSSGAVLRLPGVRVLRGNSPYWQADGEGVLLDARWVTEIALNRGETFPILAKNLARVDLSGVTRLTGPVQPDAREGAIIDFRGAAGTWSSDGFNNRQTVHASTEGQVLIPGITTFESGTITMGGGGRIDTGQLERILDSTVTVDGVDAVMGLGSLREQTGSTFRTVNGGRFVFGTLPRLVTGPVGKRVRPGESLVLAVEAEGEEPLVYQWYRNGQQLPGEVNASLRLLDIQPDDAGSYAVSVRNAAGLIVSEPAEVSLDLPVLAMTDLFARRGLITSEKGAGRASNLGASSEPGEPRHAGKRGGRSVWLTWRAPQSGVTTIRTTGSGIDTLLAVYQGKTLSAVALNPVASDEDGGGFLTSAVTFNARVGQEYEIAVDGHAGAAGELVLSWSMDLTLAVLPEIRSQPVDVLAAEGGLAQFEVGVVPGDVRFQWFRNGVAIAGATGSSLTFAGVKAADAGVYTVFVGNGAQAGIVSAPARLEVVERAESAAGLSADKLDDLFTDGEVGGGFQASRALAQAGAAGGVGVGLPGGQWTDNTQSTRSPGDPVVCDVVTTATRWFRLRLNVPAADGFVLHTEGSEVPAFLAVFTNRAALKLVGCDAASPPQKGAARVAFPARSGVDYLVLVDGIEGARGRIKLNWRLAEEQVPVRPPEFRFEGGRLVIQMYPLPGSYEWQVGNVLGGLQPVFRTNLAVGSFRYVDPEPATAAARFYWLKPVRP